MGRKSDLRKGGEGRGVKQDSSALASPEVGKKGERKESGGRVDSRHSTKRPPSPAKQQFKPPLLDKTSYKGVDRGESRGKGRGKEQSRDGHGEPKNKGQGKGSRRGSGQDHSHSSSGNRSVANNRLASFPNNRVVKGGDQDADHIFYDDSPSTRTFPAEDPRLR